jgi:hypothetical protein
MIEVEGTNNFFKAAVPLAGIHAAALCRRSYKQGAITQQHTTALQLLTDSRL